VKHTTVRDPNEVFAFKFPDVNGKLVSNDDPRFKGKVVLAIVTGTWCPNCHDEAQYLVQLYKKYHDKGLEIVALDFEEPEQQDKLSREKAFVQHYGVPYTYLIAGAPSEMWEKVPQAVNLNTWPATLFIGRDGRVKLIHSGFAAPASGEFNQQLQQEFTSTIESLLAGNETPCWLRLPLQPTLLRPRKPQPDTEVQAWFAGDSLLDRGANRRPAFRCSPASRSTSRR